MIDLRLGFKIYDNDWSRKYGMRPEQAADVLATMGATFAIAQSRFLPMQDSAVESELREGDAGNQARDDVAFRNALRERGIAYFGCLNICFDPAFTAAHPELLPVDQFGRTEEKQDWYVGLPPDREENLEHKSAILERAVPALDPDGIHLGFVRWPGFWEIWLPDVERAAMPEYCYSPRTLRRFCEAARVDLPVNDAPKAARMIAENHRSEWREWKCGITVEAIARMRATVQAKRPGTAIAINTLPFFQSDFDNAVEEVFGQDIGRLSQVVDVFEAMSYHQILRRDAIWPAAVGSDIKRRTDKRVICTLQAQALYLEGMHAGRGRSTEISGKEFGSAVDELEKSVVDGMCVFTFSQLLERQDSEDGRKMVARLSRFRRG
ncbi:hypothetical protein [Occallatibacter savannae]|uniref:hypothetical protein n=1 Tax=Occallatibacter savannae TaxID=1002691 RepID=UPI000D686922|nr:hypothetical protein [Occallatibacter savannae]